ncbi:unnamed protein product [Clavelina lepadiformis]
MDISSYIRMVLCQVLDNFLNIFSTPQNIQELKFQFYEKLQNACSRAFAKFLNYKTTTTLQDAVLAAFNVSLYLSLAKFEEVLKQANKDVVAFTCALFNAYNIECIRTVSSEFKSKWYKTKLKMLEDFILGQMEVVKENGQKQQFWFQCAAELESPRVLRKFTSFAAANTSNLISTPSLGKKFHLTSIPSIQHEFSYYKTDLRNTFQIGKKKPWRKESVYIIPGDPHQESYRLSTYLKYPPTSPANPNLLAKSGFYFTGYKDRVKCFCCGLSAENWTISDDVMAPRWHASDCTLMKKEECGNISIDALYNTIHTQRQRPCISTQNITLQSSSVSPDLQSTGANKCNGAVPKYDLRQTAEDKNQAGTEKQTTQPILQAQMEIQLANITSIHHEQFIQNLELKNEAQRMKSFDSWSTDLRTVNAIDLAQSGFFYLGNLDRVQCFSCGGVLRNWNYGDNVEAEHRRHFPHCRMVQGNEIQNVHLPLEECPTQTTASQQPSVHREPPGPSETEQNNLRQTFPCQNTVSPHLRKKHARLNTSGHRWQQNEARGTSRQIVEAGFFLLGKTDREKCWYCNGGLPNRDPVDEPWSEDAKWFPS